MALLYHIIVNCRDAGTEKQKTGKYVKAGIKLTIYPRIGYTVFPFSGGRIYNHAGCRLTPPEGMLKNKEIKDEKINGGLLCDVCLNCA